MSSRPKVFITIQDIPESALKLLNGCDIERWTENRPMPRDQFLKKIAGKDGIILGPIYTVNDETLDAAGPQLKVIGTHSVGYDHIDLPALKRRGIRLGITANVLDDAVAELTVGILLACTRRLFEGRDIVAEGKWPNFTPLFWMNGVALKNSTIGIIGLGRIGLEIAKRLVPFKVKEIIYAGRTEKPYAKEVNARRLPLDELLRESDIVIIMCSLNAETHHLIGAEQLKLMKRSAILVNASRGGVIDQDALVKALKDGTIRGAALDVMTPEPLPPDHELVSLKNCCLVPHLGSAEEATRIDMIELTTKNVVAALFGGEMPCEAL